MQLSQEVTLSQSTLKCVCVCVCVCVCIGVRGVVRCPMITLMGGILWCFLHKLMVSTISTIEIVYEHTSMILEIEGSKKLKLTETEAIFPPLVNE